MNLPIFCIKRPAFTLVINLIIMIIGIIGFLHLPVRWIPNVNPPQVSILTTYTGANAQLVEKDITKVIEESLSGINGIEMLNSSSRQGQSKIQVTFALGRNMDTAIEDIRGGVERARRELPKDAQNPIVMRADPNNMPILFLTFYDPRYTARELSDYIEKYVVPSFESIDGVGSVAVYGKRNTAMRIWLDPLKMAAANITVDEVTQSLQDQNTSIPSGQIRSKDRFYNVLVDSVLKTPAQFNELIIHNDQTRKVRLKDVAKTNFAPEQTDSALRINGRSAIAIGIVAQSTANPLEVEKNVQRALANLKRTLPADMIAEVAFNQADYIRDSIKNVYESFLEAIVFVWLVILAFLCNIRATLVPIITIPVCLIATFALLYFLGFSINTITLMAFVLAIGLVVDDAIVILENINRHIEKGTTPFSAAMQGSSEIIFPIIAMTLTLAAVYAPIAFTSGLLGVLFKEFTFTLAGAVIISGFVAVTLTPMMCAHFLKTQHSNRYSIWFTSRILSLQKHYQNLLGIILNNRKWVIILLSIIGCLGLLIVKFIPSELAPNEDMSELEAFIASPRSASFDYTNEFVKQLELIYKEEPNIEFYLSQAGAFSPSHAWQLLKLKPKSQRNLSLTDLLTSLSAKANTMTGIKVNLFAPPPPLASFAGSDSGDRTGLVLMTSSDYLRLQHITSQLIDKIKKIPGFVHVDNKLKWDSEEFQINIDKEKAIDLKVPIANISNTISTLLTGKEVGKTEDAKIIVQMNEKSLSNPNIFQQLYVRSINGNMVPLSQMLTIQTKTSPESFSRFNRLRADTIYVSLAPDFKLAKAVNILQSIAHQNLPDDVKFTFTGEAKSFLESNSSTLITFLLAIVFIYLVLVAQFESFIDPFIILLSVPFAIVGAISTLKIFGGSLNIYSNIGLITLVGLIAKHGILITSFANRLRQNGKSIYEAIIEAATLRLRPILMTTAAMILGALPLAFAFGPGAESRQQIGLVITGGMLFGTLFSLIVVPVMYSLFAPFGKIKSIVNKTAQDPVSKY